MEIIEIKTSERSFITFFSYSSMVCSVYFLFFWGYFGVGSGTHYMYFCEMIYKISWNIFYLVLIRNFTCFQ